MIQQIRRYQYVISSLWHKHENGSLREGLRVMSGQITLADSRHQKDVFTNKQIEEEYLKSNLGLGMIKEGWSFKISVILYLDHVTQIYTNSI